MNEYTKMISDCINELKQRGMTHIEIGHQLGVSDETVGRWRKGQQEPGFSQGAKLLKLAGWWIDSDGNLMTGEIPSGLDDRDEELERYKKMVDHFLNQDPSDKGLTIADAPSPAVKRLRDSGTKAADDLNTAIVKDDGTDSVEDTG